MKMNRALGLMLSLIMLTAMAVATNAKADEERTKISVLQPRAYLHTVQELALKTMLNYAAQEFEQKTPVGLAAATLESQLHVGKYSETVAGYAGTISGIVVSLSEENRKAVEMSCRVRAKTNAAVLTKRLPQQDDGIVLAQDGHSRYLFLKAQTVCHVRNR